MRGTHVIAQLEQNLADADDERVAPVVVFPICTSPLLRLGLEKILADVGFAVHREMIDDHTGLPEVPAGAPVLFIIDGNSFAEGVVDLIRKAKAHIPKAKIVLLADHFDSALVSVAWKAGADGFVYPRIHTMSSSRRSNW